jgi:hypothetical protein
MSEVNVTGSDVEKAKLDWDQFEKAVAIIQKTVAKKAKSWRKHESHPESVIQAVEHIAGTLIPESMEMEAPDPS